MFTPCTNAYLLVFENSDNHIVEYNANKSDVNSKQELEVTEKRRIKQLPDEEVQGMLLRLVPKIDQITKIQ